MSASENVATFTDSNWDQEVLKSSQPVLVDFWAEWCAPCRMMAPTIDALAEQFAGRAKIGKLNVDENGSVSERYQITAIPALLVFKDGAVMEQLVGVTSRDRLTSILEKYSSRS
jgi:thioredoxin 1